MPLPCMERSRSYAQKTADYCNPLQQSAVFKVKTHQLILKINCTCAYERLQTFSYVLRLAFRNALSYEFPAGYLLSHSFF